jgi:hypothetical protein
VTIPSWILLAMGVLGGLDILLFHTWKHRLRARHESRAELVTHFLRGPTYAVLFFGAPNLRFEGAWFAFLLGVLAFDLAISIADFWLEPASRESAGGLPRGEYVLHILLAMLYGALVLAVLQESGGALSRATSLAWIDDGPPFLLRALLGAMAPLVLCTGLLDLFAVLRMRPART